MKRLVVLLGVLALVLVGCGDDDDGGNLDDLTTTSEADTDTTVDEDTTEPDEETTTTEPSDEDDSDEDSSGDPDTYGDDEALDGLWDDCDDGDDDACRQLWVQSPGGSEYESFGASCGGRSESDDCGFGIGSSDADSYGDDEDLDALWDDCDDGDDDACSELYWTSPAGSEYETFGSTCGGRGDEGDCTEMVGMDEVEDLLGE